VHERRGEVEAALHAAGVAADTAVGGADQVDPFEQRVGAAAALGGGDPLQGRLQPDQLAPGHQRVERRFLQGDADRAAHRPRFGDHVVAGHRGTAAGRQQQRRQYSYRGRLAGAVGAEEAEDFPLRDGDVDALHRQHLVEGALQSLDLDRRHRKKTYSARMAGIVQVEPRHGIPPARKAESRPQPGFQPCVCPSSCP
jgi:hypothetical protein